MKATISYHFRAWGRKALPESIVVKGCRYQLERIFKHDFFAATALYQLEQGNIESGSHATAEDADGTSAVQEDADGTSAVQEDADETSAVQEDADETSAVQEDADETSAVQEGADGTSAVRVVLKLGRRSDFLGLPLRWLGLVMCRHERDNLRRLRHMSQVPHLLDKYGDTGFVYEYIEGSSLNEKPDLPDDFFNRMEELLKQIHLCRVAYIDLNKRGNILLGKDNLPYLIDFQIACYIPRLFRPLRILADGFLRILQKEDFYHLNKHKRRLSGHLMDIDQINASLQKSLWIRCHRRVGRPLTRLRRRVLYFLFRQGYLDIDDADYTNPENDPRRWGK